MVICQHPKLCAEPNQKRYRRSGGISFESTICQFSAAHLSHASTASAPWRKDLWRPLRKQAQLAPQAIVIECHRCARMSCKWFFRNPCWLKVLHASLYSGQSCQSCKWIQLLEFLPTSPIVCTGMGDLLRYDGTKIRTSSKNTAKQRRRCMNNTPSVERCCDALSMSMVKLLSCGGMEIYNSSNNYDFKVVYLNLYQMDVEAVDNILQQGSTL